MDQLQHFSHEHPLIFNEEKNIEDEINPNHFCSICNLPILLSSFYSCSNTGCMYLLHEPCAHLLPETMNHPWYPSSHFRLLKKQSNDDSHCKNCQRTCDNFTYINTSNPKISFHPMCGVPMWPIKSKHKSHPLHPLVAVGKRTSAVCNACSEEQTGYFFMCYQCNFWIHVDCALLPRIVKCTGHQHYLFLTYSNCDMYHTESSQVPQHLFCLICSAEMFGSGAYSCASCDDFAHLRCAFKTMEVVATEKDLKIDYLVKADQSWMILHLLAEKSDGNSTFDDKLLHNHTLILYNNDTESSGSSSSNIEVACCNACIEPVDPPFYACFPCHFHLHQLCSALPSRFNTSLRLRTWSKKSLCSLFYCSMCCLLGNGFSYYIFNDDDEIILEVHITCIIIPDVIKHASHKQHFLHVISNQWKTIKKCCSDPKTGYGYLYRCFDCNLIIDNVCAFLPEKIKHKYDTHPLDLITTGIANFDDNNLCEFCEEQIDTRFWYYGCEECDNLFHVKCIPSVGSLSKVKFGHSIYVSCHPPHPVTFVRMFGFGSQSCGYCKDIVEGFVDEMAFHCSDCDFWMHFKCAEECSGAEKVLPAGRMFNVQTQQTS